MKTIFLLLLINFFSTAPDAQVPVGKWKMISHINEFQGEKFDSHKALLTQRPCAAKIVYEVNADGTYRLNASGSGCDERYKKIQEKLYSETVWTIKGNTISIGNKKAPGIAQKYMYTISANKMTWVGTEGQGTITYQRL